MAECAICVFGPAGQDPVEGICPPLHLVSLAQTELEHERLVDSVTKLLVLNDAFTAQLGVWQVRVQVGLV